MSVITIPKKLIKEGELVVVSRKEYENLLRLTSVIPKDQEWFWTKEWQEKEHDADKDLRLKKINGPYRTKQKLVAALKRLKR